MNAPRRPSRRKLKSALLTLAVLAGLPAAWLAFDLSRAHATRLREFDADEVARLKTAMWRSYYGHRRVKLFLKLGELLRTQYRSPFWKSNRVAFYAARAAFRFKDGRGRADYERALPDLVRFYREIRAVSDVPFDAGRAARLELEWWIVHRERKRHPPGALAQSLAELAAEVYRVPPGRLAEHARLRAEAMEIRDTRAEQGGVAEEGWARIGALLHRSWQSLRRAVNS